MPRLHEAYLGDNLHNVSTILTPAIVTGFSILPILQKNPPGSPVFLAQPST